MADVSDVGTKCSEADVDTGASSACYLRFPTKYTPPLNTRLTTFVYSDTAKIR